MAIGVADRSSEGDETAYSQDSKEGANRSNQAAQDHIRVDLVLAREKGSRSSLFAVVKATEQRRSTPLAGLQAAACEEKNHHT